MSKIIIGISQIGSFNKSKIPTIINIITKPIKTPITIMPIDFKNSDVCFFIPILIFQISFNQRYYPMSSDFGLER